METTNETVAPVHYNPNQLVTYKVIDLDATDQAIQYPTVKVTDLEWDLENYRRKSKRLNEYVEKVGHVESRLADYLEMDSEEIVSELCEIFGFNPTKEIEFEGTATFSGTISVPLSDLSEFDINNVDFNVDINSWSHDIDINTVDVDDVTILR
ncbi:MAG: hypothetical protein EB127_25120 [Alphaproteobacteria bacterium]|nr:hypothetical protein [Alphaproteobacteria bacterium]